MRRCSASDRRRFGQSYSDVGQFKHHSIADVFTFGFEFESPKSSSAVKVPGIKRGGVGSIFFGGREFGSRTEAGFWRRRGRTKGWC